MHSWFRVLLGALAVCASAFVHADPANTCSDPYWKTTLRCAFFPDAIPQPNLNPAPVLGANAPLPPFTMVFLEDRNVRCTDGTQPTIYVDKAICANANGCGNGIERGDPIESDKWIFTVPGGTACAKEQCIALYAEPDERTHMGSFSNQPLIDLNGIHTPDPVANPVFASYNRVRIDKCTFDRFLGRSADEATNGAYTATTPGGKPVGVNLYYHGFFIIEEALRTLQNGLTYTTWKRNAPPAAKRRSCCGSVGGSQLRAVRESLPPLANAETVLFIGHSNASHGLYHNIDHIAALLASMPGFHGDVRAMFDANFQPSVENEASFATGTSGRDSYDFIWSSTSTAQGQSFVYEGESYLTTGNVALQYAQYHLQPDASCTAVHRVDAWKCNDRMHVLFNHIETPFFVREDFTDPNVDHNDSPLGFNVVWGRTKNFPWCPDALPCTPRMNNTEFRTRVTKQIATLLSGAYTRSEMAQHQDTTLTKNPTFYAWMPACGQHEGSFEDEGFFDATIATEGSASFSMRQWTEEFMKAPRNGVRKYKVDGIDGMTTTKCH
ncbi:MAG: pectin acetylesterase-family hydrolase [Thermoanaerobaculia bacterium]